MKPKKPISEKLMAKKPFTKLRDVATSAAETRDDSPGTLGKQSQYQKTLSRLRGKKLV